jgi:3-oxoacyl-[acyl-carrier protein] reductase
MPAEVALVTGASRGIGRAIARRLASDGFAVALNYSRSADGAKETASLIEQKGGEAHCIQADVSDGSQVGKMFDEVEDLLGPVGVLVNNAGVRRDSLAIAMSDEEWTDVLSANLYGTFACSRRALRPMIRARSGSIVNVASVAGLRGSPGQANYAAAKGGVIALTKTLAREVGSRGVTVNAIAPGLVATELTADMSPKQEEALIAETPSGRAGTPEEVASVVAYLCSEEAKYVNGSVFVMDGGLTA